MLAWVGAVLIAFSVAEGASRDVLSVRSIDGTWLHVTLYRTGSSDVRPILILTGDRGAGTQDETLDALAAALFHRGLDVVLWDQRGTGKSGGVFDDGFSAPTDLAAVVDAVRHVAPQQPLGLVGVGTGGVAALKRAADDKRIGAVAVYGVGIRGTAPHSEGYWGRFFSYDTIPGRWLAKLWGIRLSREKIPPREQEELAGTVTRFKRRPLLVAIGSEARRVSVDEARQLFQVANPPKEWMMAPGFADQPPVSAWAPRLEAFFRKFLYR